MGTEGTYHSVKVKAAQLCLTVCDPMYCTVHGTLQARTLEWVAIPSSKGSSQPSDRTQVSCLASDSLLFEPPEKVNISLLHNSTISFLGIYSREIKVRVHRNLYTFMGNLLWPKPENKSNILQSPNG